MELYVLVNDAAGSRWGRRWAYAGEVTGQRAFDLAAEAGGGSRLELTVGGRPSAQVKEQEEALARMLGALGHLPVRSSGATAPEVLARFVNALGSEPRARGWIQVRPSGLPTRAQLVELRACTSREPVAGLLEQHLRFRIVRESRR